MDSGFLPKTQGLGMVFVFLLYLTNIGLQSDFIQPITESSYSLKTTKQLSATYKPYLKHIDHESIRMHVKKLDLITHHTLIILSLINYLSLWHVTFFMGSKSSR